MAFGDTACEHAASLHKHNHTCNLCTQAIQGANAAGTTITNQGPAGKEVKPLRRAPPLRPYLAYKTNAADKLSRVSG